MDIPSFILIACLIGNGSPDCQKQVEACVNTKRLEAVKEAVKQNTEKKGPVEDLVISPPSGEWAKWILACSKEIKK